MPSSGGPNTLGENNLIFAYDTGDVSNSYKGEPTTNYIWHQNPRIDASYESYMPEAGNGTITQNHPGAIRVYNGNGTDISYYINAGVGDWTNQRHAYWIFDQILKRPVVRMYNENGSWQSKYYNPDIGSLTNIGVSAGTTYVISWLQYVESLDRSAYVGLYSYSNTNGYNNFWDGLQAAYNTQTNTWQRVYAIFTATNNGQLGNSTTGYTYGHSIGSGELRVADMQLEVKTHPTPYSNSLTRSSTQGLLPLIGTSTLDLTNMSFDSNAQMVFDGTDDYINVSNSTLLQVGDFFTISAWIYPTNLNSRYGVFSTRRSNDAGSWQLEVGTANGGTNRVAVTGVGTWIFETQNNVISLNVWTNICFVKQGNGVQGGILYINGVASSPLTTTAYIILNNSNDKVIGSGTNISQFFPGKITNTLLYDRALTSNEVKQNYQQYKTRFNLS